MTLRLYWLALLLCDMKRSDVMGCAVALVDMMFHDAKQFSSHCFSHTTDMKLNPPLI